MKISVSAPKLSWSYSGALPDGRVFIGTGAHADIAMPRAQFLSFAQRELELCVDGGAVVLRHLGIAPCLLDGAVVKQAPIAAGKHRLVIGEIELDLELG